MNNEEILSLVKNCMTPKGDEIDNVIKKLKKILNEREVSASNFVIIDCDKHGKEFKYKILYLSDVRRYKKRKIKVVYNKKLNRYEILTLNEAKKYIEYLSTHTEFKTFANLR
jgi:hypothetical protein